jgi:hypothetical protein
LSQVSTSADKFDEFVDKVADGLSTTVETRNGKGAMPDEQRALNDV